MPVDNTETENTTVITAETVAAKAPGINALNSINEQEQVDAIYAYAKVVGKKITKTDINFILDSSDKLIIQALKEGKSIKRQGLMTIKPSLHKGGSYSVPHPSGVAGEFLTGTYPEKIRITAVESDELIEALNPSLVVIPAVVIPS